MPHVLNLEFLLGAMKQHTQVFALDAKLPANFIAIALVEKYRLQQRAVPLRQLQQDLPNFLFDLPRRDDIQRIRSRRNRFGRTFCVKRLTSARRTVLLKEHMVADGIHKRAKTLRLPQSTIPSQNGKHPRKGLLAYIFNCVGRLQPRAKLQAQELTEIRNEVRLRLLVACAKIVDVTRVK